jgi:hypothetical protein
MQPVGLPPASKRSVQRQASKNPEGCSACMPVLPCAMAQSACKSLARAQQAACSPGIACRNEGSRLGMLPHGLIWAGQVL